MYSSLPRGVPRCQHIKVNGTRCDSPALKGKAYCYFHFRNRLPEPAPAAPPPTANGRQPAAALADGRQPKAEGSLPLSPPSDLFLLEDANSIQCALQWVLRRILDASMDHRQASLLLYGLQIAAANIKRTRFQPSYDDLIRALPAENVSVTVPEAVDANRTPAECSGAVPAAVAAGEPALSDVEGPAAVAPAPNAGDPAPTNVEASAPARAGRPRDSRQDAGATLNQPASSPASPPPPPSLPSADPQPSTIAEGLEAPAEIPTDSRLLTPDSRNLPTDHCPLATASSQLLPAPLSPKRPARRPRAASAVLDRQMLSSSPRAALSLMFQREVRRHLARLNFPASPDSDPET